MKLTALLIAFVSLTSYGIHKAATAAPNAAGTVAPTGNMTAIRFDHAAALLPTGRVLIVGGIERNGVMQPSAEVFDPNTGRFTATAKPQSPHGWGVTAVPLSDGKVLVAGGSSSCDAPCYTASAELYDPIAGTFTSTASMTAPRAGPRTLLLPTGDVLFVGGGETSSGAFATAELYHPSTRTFSFAGATDLSDPVQVLLLRNGLVLVLDSSAANLYDPSNRRFTPAGKMTTSRTKFGAALLPDGRVLVAGGQSGGAWGPRLSTTEIYDAATSKFAPGPELNLKRFKLSKAVVPLKDGRILIAGGAAQLELYDPASNAFLMVSGSKLDGFCFSTATLLKDGRVLLAGGYASPGGAGVNHAWLYQP